MLMLRK
jgi:predicted  nucleic acid-binding Zn-ribbon protein